LFLFGGGEDSYAFYLIVAGIVYFDRGDYSAVLLSSVIVTISSANKKAAPSGEQLCCLR
jgi:hypothetical protein